MSFLSGLVNFGKSAFTFLSGNSIASTLVRTIGLGLVINQLSKNALKDNNTNNDANIDKGVRLQVPPASDNKIPVLYGTAFFGGIITDAEMSADNKTMYYVLTLSETTGIRSGDDTPTEYVFKDIYWNDQRIVFDTDGITVDYTVDREGTVDLSASGLVEIYCFAGSSTDPVVPENYTNASLDNAYDIMPSWTVDHTMDELLFAIVKVTYNREKNVTGIGNLKFHLESNMNNPGDVLYDYMTNTRYGAGILPAEIFIESTFYTYSQESLSYEDQGTGAETLENRYQINGVIDTSKPVLDNIEKICSAAGSWLSYNIHEGFWGVVINKAGTSQASFDDSNILGSISLSGTGLQDLYNSVKVQFPHRDLKDSGDFVSIEIPEEDRNANEEDNTLNISYDIINEPIQAQLLGFIELKQSRVDLVIKFQTDFSYISLRAGDIIDVTNTRFDFTNKLFRIITITEVQNDDGALLMEITALEYDSNVYSTDDLYRYTRTDTNGIITIGSIGVPGTPQITKYEVDARPRILVESLAPTGVVEGLEFWLSEDVTELEANRNYTLIATRRPEGGGTFTSGTNITLDYDNLDASNFVIKTRGFNTITVGPFSDPSGYVYFAPTQITDGIGPDTGVYDSTGGLLTALAAIELLGKIDDLFGGSSTGSILDKILDSLWPDRSSNMTAAELLQEDTAFLSELSGTINDLNNVSIDELQDVDTTTVAPTVNDKLTWDGANWVPSGATEASGAVVAWARAMVSGDEMLVDSSFNIDTKVDKVFTDDKKDWKFSFATSQPGNAYVVLAIQGEASTYTEGTSRPDSAKVFNVYNQKVDSFILHADSTLAEGELIYLAVIGTTGMAGANLLEVTSKTPSDRATQANPLSDGTGDVIAVDATVSITFNVSDVYSLAKGSGTARLYKSNGTLAGSLPASSLVIDQNVVTLPFATRDYGTDYYILMEKGMITGQGDGVTYYSPAIGTPTYWNFHTRDADPPAGPQSDLAPAPVSPAYEPANFKPIPPECGSLKYINFIAQSKYAGDSKNKVHRQSNIQLVFNNPISFGTSGTITIASSSGTHQQFNIADTFKSNKVSELLWIDGKKLVVNPTVDFVPGRTYWLTIQANCVYDGCGINGNEAILDTSIIRWTVDPGPQPNT